MLKRLSFSLECASLLYLISFIVAVVRLWYAATLHSPEAIVGLLAPPLLASILFILVSLAVPDLLEEGRMVSPLNVTVPLVFMTLMFVALELGPSMELSLVRIRHVFSWALMWKEPAMLAVGVGLQMATLSILVWTRRSRVPNR